MQNQKSMKVKQDTDLHGKQKPGKSTNKQKQSTKQFE